MFCQSVRYDVRCGTVHDLINLVAAVKYVPSWFPGTEWQRQAADWCQATNDMIELPFKKALDHIVRKLYFMCALADGFYL